MGLMDKIFKKDTDKSKREVGSNFNKKDADDIFDALDKHDMKESKKISDGMKKEINQTKEISALMNEAKGLEKSGKYDESIKIYEKIIAIEPDASEAYEKLADIYSAKNDTENETKVLKLAVKNIKNNKVKNRFIERLKKLN